MYHEAEGNADDVRNHLVWLSFLLWFVFKRRLSSNAKEGCGGKYHLSGQETDSCMSRASHKKIQKTTHPCSSFLPSTCWSHHRIYN